jgi:hypothetical protein
MALQDLLVQIFENSSKKMVTSVIIYKQIKEVYLKPSETLKEH